MHLTLDAIQLIFLCPCRKDIVFQKLLCQCARTFIGNMTSRQTDDAIGSGADDTLDIDAVMLIKTFVLDRYDRMLHMQRNIADGYCNTVGIGTGKLLDHVAVAIVDVGGIADGHDISLADIRCGCQYSSENTQPETDTADKQKYQ